MKLREKSYIKTGKRYCISLSLIDLYDRNGKKYRLRSDSLNAVIQSVDFEVPIVTPPPIGAPANYAIHDFSALYPPENDSRYGSIAQPSRSPLRSTPPPTPFRTTSVSVAARLLPNATARPEQESAAWSNSTTPFTRDEQRIFAEHHQLLRPRLRPSAADTAWQHCLKTFAFFLFIAIFLAFFLAMAYWIAHAEG